MKSLIDQLVCREDLPATFSDQQEQSAEWRHFIVSIGAGPAAIKNPRK